MHHFSRVPTILSFFKSFIVYCSLSAPLAENYSVSQVRRLVSLEKEQKLSLRYGIETFSKKRLGRDLYETKYVLG